MITTSLSHRHMLITSQAASQPGNNLVVPYLRVLRLGEKNSPKSEFAPHTEQRSVKVSLRHDLQQAKLRKVISKIKA